MGVGRPVGGITSPAKMVANIFVSFIGAGMLGLPFAFMEGGIMEGAVIMGVVGYLSVTAMLMLIDCKYAILTSGGRAGGRSIIMDTKVPLITPDSSSGDEGEDDERHPPMPSTDLTYGDVGLYALGPSGKRLVDVAIIISQIGFCCGYLIYLCKNLNLYIPRISQRVWLVFLLPPLYFLTLLRHLNKLAIFSMFAQVSNVLALAVVFWFDFSHSEEVPFTPNEYSLAGFPFFFAVAIYCYEGAGMILSLEESMAEHKRHKFRSIFVCTMTGLTLLYICFGVSGYASFGPHTMDIITLNLPHGTGAVDFAAIVKICLGVSLFFTYPMMLFPITHLLDKTFGFNAAPTKGNIMRLVLVILTGVVVTAVPNFAILMSLIGATCCTLLAFILPASFHLSIFRQRLTKRQRYFDIMLIVIGVLGSIIGLWDAFKRMNEAHDPLLDLNEFASVKNGSLHPSLNQPTTVLPVQRAGQQSTLAGIVITDITKAEEKYGGGGGRKVEAVTTERGYIKNKSEIGDSKVIASNSKPGSKVNKDESKVSSESTANRPLSKSIPLDKKAGKGSAETNETDIVITGKGKDINAGTVADRNKEVNNVTITDKNKDINTVKTKVTKLDKDAVSHVKIPSLPPASVVKTIPSETVAGLAESKSSLSFQVSQSSKLSWSSVGELSTSMREGVTAGKEKGGKMGNSATTSRRALSVREGESLGKEKVRNRAPVSSQKTSVREGVSLEKEKEGNSAPPSKHLQNSNEDSQQLKTVNMSSFTKPGVLGLSHPQTRAAKT